MAIIERIKLSPEQRRAFEKIENSNENYFVTGNAGTGKSYLLEYFLKHTKKNAVVLAPTGVAALNVHGQTIHSFFGIPPQNVHRGDPETHRKMSKNKQELIRKLDTLVIDEISMVSSTLLDIVDDRLQFVRRNHAPFGGCQVVFFGDLYQLPPVVRDSEKQYVMDRYGTEFFFGVPSVRYSGMKIINLEKVFRQTDNTFIDTLNKIRSGREIEEALEVINSRVTAAPEGSKFLTLTPYNRVADRINLANLNKINEKLYNFQAGMRGKFRPQDAPAPLNLPLKVGARVMIVINDYENEKPRFVNGSFATVQEISRSGIFVKIGKKKHMIRPEVWENTHLEYDEEGGRTVAVVDGNFHQLPMRLAYAVTIHKSQGQTYDGLNLDLSRGAFAAGQAYVALSRCRSLEGLYLTRPLRADDIMINPTVIRYMEGLGE